MHGAVRRLFATTPSRNAADDYELLSSDSSSRSEVPFPNGLTGTSTRRRAARGICYCFLRFFMRKRIIVFIFSLPFLLIVLVLMQGVPPSFEDIRIFERNLPQHHLSEASDGMYLRFPGHLWGHGLNNILQESILMSYLAFKTQRSFVFEDYVWSHTPFPYTIYDFALRPARIPMNAFISGPTAGGPIEGPRAISAEFWDLVCPRERRRVISSNGAPVHGEGDAIIEWWVGRLKDVQDPCVEVDSSSTIVFDRFLFGSPRVLSIWPGLSSSPILTNYTWSPLVQSAISRNFAILQPNSAKVLYDISSNTTLSGLVAVHLRHGDYKRHCPRLAQWEALYMGFNQFPTLPDKFDPTPFIHEPHSRREEYYLQHCLPTVEQIVARLHSLRLENAGLRRVYVLTNGWGWWLNGLKSALRDDGWDDVKSSFDIRLDSEQKWASMAVDMAIAEKAEVFVGNGFSSLTSNIVMLRMSKGLDVLSNRFL